MRKNAGAFAAIISHRDVDVNVQRKVTFWSPINETIMDVYVEYNMNVCILQTNSMFLTQQAQGIENDSART